MRAYRAFFFFFFLPSFFFLVCSLPSWKAETDGFCGAAIPSAVMSTSSLIKWNLDTTIFLGQTREQQMRAWGTSRAAAVAEAEEEEEEATERKRGWRGGDCESAAELVRLCVVWEARWIGERGSAAECHRVTACLCFLTRWPGPASASGAPQTQMSQQREYIGCLICILCTSFLGAFDMVDLLSLADLNEDFLFWGRRVWMKQSPQEKWAPGPWRPTGPSPTSVRTKRFQMWCVSSCHCQKIMNSEMTVWRAIQEVHPRHVSNEHCGRTTSGLSVDLHQNENEVKMKWGRRKSDLWEILTRCSVKFRSERSIVGSRIGWFWVLWNWKKVILRGRKPSPGRAFFIWMKRNERLSFRWLSGSEFLTCQICDIFTILKNMIYFFFSNRKGSIDERFLPASGEELLRKSDTVTDFTKQLRIYMWSSISIHADT